MLKIERTTTNKQEEINCLHNVGQKDVFHDYCLQTVCHHKCNCILIFFFIFLFEFWEKKISCYCCCGLLLLFFISSIHSSKFIYFIYLIYERKKNENDVVLNFHFSASIYLSLHLMTLDDDMWWYIEKTEKLGENLFLWRDENFRFHQTKKN